MMSNVCSDLDTNGLPWQKCAFCSPEICPVQKSCWGCNSKCRITCNPKTCQWTCPEKPQEFFRRWTEVGGYDTPPTPYLLPPTSLELPNYIPLIQHFYSFKNPLQISVAAVNTFDILRKLQKGGYATREEFLSSSKLNPNTALLLISVAKDSLLELYWSNRKVDRLPEKLAQLGIQGITIPNFSYFSDAPPVHIRWNYRRLMIIADEFSQAGIGIIPHLNALSDGDWMGWQKLLQEQPHLKFVAKEFQTGARRNSTIGKKAIDELIRLQDMVGRSIHPIVIGGARYWYRLSQRFASFTVIDSTPFMKSINRQRIHSTPNGSIGSERAYLAKGEPIDNLWSENIREYQKALQARGKHHFNKSVILDQISNMPFVSGSLQQVSSRIHNITTIKSALQEPSALPF